METTIWAILGVGFSGIMENAWKLLDYMDSIGILCGFERDNIRIIKGFYKLLQVIQGYMRII